MAVFLIRDLFEQLVDITGDLFGSGKHIFKISAPFQKGLQIIIIQQSKPVGDELRLKHHDDQFQRVPDFPAVGFDIVKQNDVTVRYRIDLTIDKILSLPVQDIGDLKAGMPVKMIGTVIRCSQRPVLDLKRKSRRQRDL